MDSVKDGREPTVRSEASVVAAAEDLASLSLDGGAPNIEDEKFCSNCGETDDDLKGCKKCRCIWYCSASCQQEHLEVHKTECERIEAVLKNGETFAEEDYLDLSEEVNDEESGLFSEPPERPDCHICMIRLPIELRLWTYRACCGKMICSACNFDNMHACYRNEMDWVCPFCRAPTLKKDQKFLCMEKRAGLGDAEAMWMLASHYRDGDGYVARDESKALQWFKKSADLGNGNAQDSLGCAYKNGSLGVEVDKIKALRYFELAAKSGNVLARHDAGLNVNLKPDAITAVKHWRISAAAGYAHSVSCLINAFEFGFISHKDLSPSLRARDKARLEMKSESRDRYIAHLKRTGRFDELGVDASTL